MENLSQSVRYYQYTTLIPTSLLMLDGVVILGVSELLYRHTDLFNYFSTESFMFLSVIMAVSWALSALFARTYQIDNLGRPRKIIKNSLVATGLHSIILLLLVGLRMPVNKLSEGLVLYGVTIASVLILKLFLLHLYRWYRHQSVNRRNVIVIGATQRGQELMRYFKQTHSLSQQLLGFFNGMPDESAIRWAPYLGSLEEVKSYCMAHHVREVYYALDNHHQYLNELSAFADKHFIFLGIVPYIDGLDYRKRIGTHLLDDSRIPVITSRKVPLHHLVNMKVKRAFDVIFSLVTLFGLSLTIFPVIALAIRLTSPGPIFFRQLRPGRNNRLFWCYKFRTMYVSSDEATQATKNDRRITNVGIFLRKTSLDELPQFYNVLRGEMSVVGPRPNLVRHLEEYPQVIREYSLRHWITPGITGYAQVNGYRGETREVYQMVKRVEYDLLYMENWSLLLDLKIIWRTLTNMAKGEENAY